MIVVIFTADKVIENCGFLRLPVEDSAIRCYSLEVLISGFLDIARSPTECSDDGLDEVLISGYRHTFMVLLEHLLDLWGEDTVSFESSMNMEGPIGKRGRQVVSIGAEFGLETILYGILKSVLMC